MYHSPPFIALPHPLAVPPPLPPDLSGRLLPYPTAFRVGLDAGFPVTDALVNDNFDKVYRRGQAGVNSALQAVQGRLKVAHSVASGIVMLLVKGSVEVRTLVYMETQTLKWWCGNMACCCECALEWTGC